MSHLYGIVPCLPFYVTRMYEIMESNIIYKWYKAQISLILMPDFSKCWVGHQLAFRSSDLPIITQTHIWDYQTNPAPPTGMSIVPAPFKLALDAYFVHPCYYNNYSWKLELVSKKIKWSHQEAPNKPNLPR